MRKNIMKTWAILSFFIFIVGIALLGTGLALNNRETLWMAMSGAIIAIIFFICYILLLKQAKILTKMFHGDGILTHWVYTDKERRTWVQEERKTRLKNNFIFILVVTAMFLLIGGFSLFYGFRNHNTAVTFSQGVTGILALLWLYSILSPYLSAVRLLRSAPETFITRNGAWMMGRYTIWGVHFTQLSDLWLDRGQQALVLVIVYSVWQRFGWQKRTVQILVPEGKEEEAHCVVDRIKMEYGLNTRNCGGKYEAAGN